MLSNPLKRSSKRLEKKVKFFWFFVVLFVTYPLAVGLSTSLTDEKKETDCMKLFHEAKIEEAAQVARWQLLQNAEDGRAWKTLGWIELMKNHLEEAQFALQKGLKANPDDTEMKRLLAICYYRENNLEQAAELLDEIKEKWTANLLRHLEPKAFNIQGDFSCIKLHESTPFVVIPVTVCNKTVPLFLDTRGSFTALDRDLYEKMKKIRLLDVIALQFWFNFAGKWSIRSRIGTFNMKVGNLKIENVPVLLARWKGTYLFPRHVPQIVHGVLGTDWMRQFTITIDYPQKVLFLRKKESLLESTNVDKESGLTTKIPFYLTPGGQIVIEGKINDQGGNFFLVDTLSVGRPFTCSEWIIHKYHLARYGGWIIGQRRGSMYPHVYAVIPKIQIGNIIKENVPASIGKNYDFPPSIDHKQGFPIGLIVGNGFFKSYEVTFDFQKMELVLKSKKTVEEKSEKSLALKQ
ncbi:hypothetical protein A7Q10_08670 [Methylacidiphilum caldifontis]|uniref:Uncharacterized protein n=2 Tax=Methylacidiphilum caldifontis TaxID=2795386 RepID=A0A4Y8PBG6_9BACT|nr:hypothetical protein A7Q10_08670 [Methylacidiphilum caldifontis]